MKKKHQIRSLSREFVDRGDLLPEDQLQLIYSAVAASVAGMIIADQQGQVVFMNHRAQELLCVDDEPGRIARNYRDFLPITRSDDGSIKLQTPLDWSFPDAQEVQLVRTDGSTFVAEVHCALVPDIGDRKAARVISFTNIDKRKSLEAARDQLVDELKTALDQVKTLRGLVPICAWCKKIRDDKGFWEDIEAFISKHSDACFSHGICPDCAEKTFPGIGAKIRLVEMTKEKADRSPTQSHDS